MDRALLERMVGAVVLVLLLVVVAPWLLDGGSEQNESQSDVQSGTGTRTEVIVLNAPRQTSQVPVQIIRKEAPTIRKDAPTTLTEVPSDSSAPRNSAANDAAVTIKPVRSAPQPKQPSTVRRQRESGFAVQLGSFGEEQNARQYAAKLKGAGYAIFIRPAGSVHRVYAGPRPDREAAEKLADVMSQAGYKGMVIELDNR